MSSPEGFNIAPSDFESKEKAPFFDYIFYDYSDRMSTQEIFSVQARTNEEAFREFELQFGRKYGESNYDGFIRQ
ncbi:MAG: hypothetical protein WCP24_01780 [bacterium]